MPGEAAEKGFLCVRMHMRVCRKKRRTLKRSSFKQRWGNTCGWSRNSSLQIAQGCPDSPCWADLALTSVHSPSVSLGAGQAINPSFCAINKTNHNKNTLLLNGFLSALIYLMLEKVEQNQEHILSLLVELVRVKCFLHPFSWNCCMFFFWISPKVQKRRNCDVVAYLWRDHKWQVW